MCRSTHDPSLSPISRLFSSADTIGQLTPASARLQAIEQFNEFRELLWAVIEMALDPAPYTLAWNLINLHARVDLLEFERGNNEALVRLQEKVKEAIQLLP
jgi:hypothetical protein